MKKRIEKAKKYIKWQKPNQAIAELQPVLKNKKNTSWVPYHLIGIALSQKGNHDSSARFMKKAIEYGSDQPETYHMLSVNYSHIGRLEKAEEYGKEAVRLKEDFLKAWLNLGLVYSEEAKLEEALQCFKKVNQLDPNNADVAYRIGKIYRDLGNMNKAHQLFDFALKIDSEHKNAFLAKADLFKNTAQYDEAEKYVKEAQKKFKDKETAGEVVLADISRQRGDYDKAIKKYEEILEGDSTQSLVRVNYALNLQEIGRFKESEKNYRRAIEELTENKGTISNYLLGLHYNPENNREFIYKEHLRLGKEFSPSQKPKQIIPENTDKHKKLKIGFISGGFRRHPVGFMITGALEQLSDEQFEVFCYTTNNKHDFVTQRIHQNIDHWRPIVGYRTQVVEKIIKEDEIDILVDLSGHARHSRLEVMSQKPAPIIVKWVGGLFNTTGLDAFDFIISDWYETPDGAESYYTEELVRLPDDYIVYTPPAYALKIGPPPSEDKGFITFGCFNNPTKVNEVVLKQWAEIMKKVPDSHLFLKSKQYDTASLKQQIIDVLEREGIDASRIRFKGHTQQDKHIGAYNEIDIALDPWPYSGGLTTCEALYMGVPVVTMPGPTFAGRHSTTHLINAGLPELVTESWGEYIEKAVALATDCKKLKQMKEGLRDQILNSPLCNGKRFGAHLSVAFREMWKQWCEGYKGEAEEWQSHIEVEPLSDKEIGELTEGPDEVSPIGLFNHSKDETPTSETEKKSDIKHKDSVLKSTENMNEIISLNGRQEKATNGELQSQKADEVYRIETKDGVTICTPADLEMLTPYVLLEQEQWFEPELKFVREYLQPGMKAIDAGAGFGAYALPMARQVGEEGSVYAFEPGAIARRHLEMSKLENNCGQLEIAGRALGEEAREAKMHIAETPELNRVDKEGEEPVTITTLDAWWQFAGKPQIDLIKVDVNGMEPRALRGAQALLEKVSPVILTSIGENEQSLEALRGQLQSMDYQLFEYIPGPKLLAEHEPQAGVDGYLMNVIALKEDRIDEFKAQGWIYDEDVEFKVPEVDRWVQVLNELPWTESFMDEWKEKADSGHHEEYLQALNLICAAEQMKVALSEDSTAPSRKGVMLLQAAQKLIDLFNSGQAGIEAAMIFARVMYQLGKREQAVEMMKELMETINTENVKDAMPFLPPLPEQDKAPIQTDFPKWLTVRIVEAWISMKDASTYMSGEKEKQMLKALEGNPEVCLSISRASRVIQFKDGETNYSRISDFLEAVENKEISFNSERSNYFNSMVNMIHKNRPERFFKHELPGELVVSLTSYPDRFEKLPLTLLGLINQSVKPDKIILWIAEEDKNALDEDILQFRDHGVEICFCEDLESYKKIIPTLETHPNAFIITADDDLYYNKRWVEGLVKEYENSKNVIAYRVHRISFTQSGSLKPYKEWGWQYHASFEPSDLNFPTSGAGTLYPPGIFYKDVTNTELFQKLSPTADDVWLFFMVKMNGGKFKVSRYEHKLMEWKQENPNTLWKENLLNGKNDEQIDNIINFYGRKAHLEPEVINSQERIFRPKFSNQYVTVFSHPRSGTHFLEAFIGRNFYKNENFETTDVTWGHWANRRIANNSNKYYKLFGSHVFPTVSLRKIDYPVVYICRDGRAVAYSIWKTENFLHPKHKNITFSNFLRLKLDWKGSPAFKSSEKMNIIQHWEQHVLGWLRIAKENKNILVIKYKDLIDNPYKVYLKIHKKFFDNKKQKQKLENEIDKVLKPVGLKPNKAIKDSWKDKFNTKDKEFFCGQLNNYDLFKDLFE